MKTISNPKLGDILKKSLRMPETFMLAGALGAGLMAGGEALLALPIVGTAHAVAVRNIMQNKPEHNGHPKLIAAVSATLFAGIGVASGNLFVSLAHLIGAGVLVSIECRITPGGASAIMDDIKNGLQKIWGQATPPQDILVPAYGAKPLMALQPLNMRLRPHFSAYNKGAQIAMKHKRRHIRTLSRLRPQVARCRIIYRLKIR